MIPNPGTPSENTESTRIERLPLETRTDKHGCTSGWPFVLPTLLGSIRPLEAVTTLFQTRRWNVLDSHGPTATCSTDRYVPILILHKTPRRFPHSQPHQPVTCSVSNPLEADIISYLLTSAQRSVPGREKHSGAAVRRSVSLGILAYDRPALQLRYSHSLPLDPNLTIRVGKDTKKASMTQPH